VGGVDRSLSGQHQRCVSRLIGSDPTRISRGCTEVLGQCCSFPSLRANRMASTTATRNGNPTELELSAQPASHRLTGCGPYSQHHPSQPVMRYLKAANGSGSASRMPDLVRVVGVRWVGMGARYVRFRPGRFRGVGSVRSRPLKEVS